MYAIIESGSHQYRVSTGDRIQVDKRPEEAGSEVTFDKVLLVAEEGQSPAIGAPLLTGATVSAKVIRTFRGKKVIIQKFRRRKGYRRKKGHRQTYTTVEITGISRA
jgi:large subunit ribosomal protein L21